MFRLSRKGQSIVEYVIIIAVAAAACIALYRIVQLRVTQKIGMVSAER